METTAITNSEMTTNAIPDSESLERAKRVLPNENPPTVTTMSVKLIKNSSKQMHVMQFNEAQHVKFADWKRVRLRRENNSTLQSHIQSEPKFRGGSTFGRAAREEARLRRYTRRYDPSSQPWILTADSTNGDKCTNDKSFKGRREGGVGENSTYYIFIMNSDGKSVSAYPVKDWYKFRSTQRYKTLSVEEAEEEFMRRNDRLNYFSLMTLKRLRSEEEDGGSKSQAKATKQLATDLKISELDEWISSNEDEDDDDDDADADKKQNDSDNDKKKKKKKANSKKKNVSNDEAFEESDDGDEEGRECEYISDSSATESELEQQKEAGYKSVAEENGLMKLLSSGSESNSGELSEDESTGKNKAKNKKNKKKPGKEKPTRGADKSVNLQGMEKDNERAGGNLLSVAEDKFDGKGGAKFHKRTMSVSSDEAQVKRYKYEPISTSLNSSHISEDSGSGITVEAVSRYLKRKPMTLVELLKKFKSKKTGLSKEDICRILILTLQKIKLNQKKIKGVTYYSL